MPDEVPQDVSKPADVRADYEDYDDAPQFPTHAVTSFTWSGLIGTGISLVFGMIGVYLRAGGFTILVVAIGAIFAWVGLALSWEGYKTIQNPIKMPEKHVLLFIRLSWLFSAFIALLYLLAFIGGMCLFGLLMGI